MSASRTNFVSEADICSGAHNSDVYEIADNLVKAANENGGGDNITVVALSN